MNTIPSVSPTPHIRLAAFDVDGTLTDSSERIPDEVGRALARLHARGVTVAIVTGRTLSEVNRLREAFPFLRYYVISNGAGTFDAQEGRWIGRDLLDLSAARAVFEAAKALPLMFELYADGTAYVERRCWEAAAYYDADFLMRYLYDSRTPIPDMAAFLARRTAGVEKVNVFFHRACDRETLVRFCAPLDATVTVSTRGSFELNRRGVSKGKALAALGERLGVSPAETAAAGDGAGDIPMLQYAGMSFAMGNASPAVQKSARFVAPDCDNGGACWIIEQILSDR